jgi:hypothetical protein
MEPRLFAPAAILIFANIADKIVVLLLANHSYPKKSKGQLFADNQRFVSKYSIQMVQ